MRQQQNIQFALMVPYHHHGTFFSERFFAAVEDVEGDARGEGHGVCKGAGGEALSVSVAAEDAEEEGDEDAVGCAEEEVEVGDEGAEGEGGGEGVAEEEDESDVEDEEVETVEEEGMHFLRDVLQSW